MGTEKLPRGGGSFSWGAMDQGTVSMRTSTPFEVL
jgi:hypothetical protein